MSFPRIVVFAVVLAALRLAVSALLGESLAAGPPTGRELARFLFVYFVPDGLAVTTVLAVYGRLQERRPYLGALLVVLLNELLAYALLLGTVLRYGLDWPTTHPLFSWVYLGVLTLSWIGGTAPGIRLRQRSL